jgi:hypothetical protein
MAITPESCGRVVRAAKAAGKTFWIAEQAQYSAGMLTFSTTTQSPYNLQSTKDGSSTSIALVGRDANARGGKGGPPGPLGLTIP